jgi:uncharacterized protein (DUF1778 family)
MPARTDAPKKKSEDSDRWSQARSRAYQLNVMVNETERAEILAAADKASMPVTTFMRWAALRAARGE